MHGSVLIFAIILFSDDVLANKFRAYHFLPTSCHAHAQWASIWMNTVSVLGQCWAEAGHCFRWYTEMSTGQDECSRKSRGYQNLQLSHLISIFCAIATRQNTGLTQKLPGCLRVWIMVYTTYLSCVASPYWVWGHGAKRSFRGQFVRG